MGGLFIGGLCLTWGMNEWVRRESAPHMHSDADSVPHRSVAIVPGAMVFADGTPSSVLEDRLEAARVLHEAGRVERILVSGDHQGADYDEPNAMRRWLVARGVPSGDVFMDHAGIRTFDTMERAARVFLVRDAVVCTNEFHLGRSVFLARKAGIDAVGLVADRRPYRGHVKNLAREVLARSRAFLDVYVLGTRARHLGPPIPIDGGAEASHDRWTRR